MLRTPMKKLISIQIKSNKAIAPIVKYKVLFGVKKPLSLSADDGAFDLLLPEEPRARLPSLCVLFMGAFPAGLL